MKSSKDRKRTMENHARPVDSYHLTHLILSLYNNRQNCLVYITYDTALLWTGVVVFFQATGGSGDYDTIC